MTLKNLKTLNNKMFGFGVVKNQNDKTLKNVISTKLRFLYYLLKNTPYNNENNKEFHFIYTYFLTLDIGLSINNYYKINVKQDRLIYDIMKNEYIKFFDHSKSCIINLKNNKDFAIIVNIYYKTDNFKNPTLVKIEIKPDIPVLLQGLKICQEKKKYTSDNIISNLYIYLYFDNILSDEGHANTLIFNKSKREIYRVEPNYATKQEIESMIPEDKKYYNYFETLFSKPMNDALSGYFNGKIDYTFKGYYDFNNNYPTHGGFCNFLSILTVYTKIKLTREIIKENLLNFIKWEYRNFSGKNLNERFNFNDYKNSLTYFLNILQGEYLIESMLIDNQPFTEKQQDIFNLENFKGKKFNKVNIKIKQNVLNFIFEFKI